MEQFPACRLKQELQIIASTKALERDILLLDRIHVEADAVNIRVKIIAESINGHAASSLTPPPPPSTPAPANPSSADPVADLAAHLLSELEIKIVRAVATSAAGKLTQAEIGTALGMADKEGKPLPSLSNILRNLRDEPRCILTNEGSGYRLADWFLPLFAKFFSS